MAGRAKVVSAVKIGTKSLLFGCHQFLWHPFTVALAYRKLFRVWPNFEGWLCLLFHDVGYWGCADIDGPQGKLHPLRGSLIVGEIVYRLRRITHRKEPAFLSRLHASHSAVRCLLHSRSLASDNKVAPSDICWADKYSLFFEPEWFYLLRTSLSGELAEFIANAVNSGYLPHNVTGRQWLRWFKDHLLHRPEIHDMLQYESPVRNHLLRNTPRALKWKTHVEKTRSEPAARIHTNRAG
jgi:hypothetical protein